MENFCVELQLRKFIALCFLLTYLLPGSDSFDCYTCTYSISGNPSLNYECANRPWNVTTGSPVNTCASSGSYCVTKVVYQHDSNMKLQIWSIDRGCRRPEVIGCGINCCELNSHNYVCQYQCQDSKGPCNSLDVSKAPSTGTGTASKTNTSLFNSFIVIILCLLNYKLF